MKFQCHGCGEEAVEGSLCHELALLSCDSFLRYWCAECGGGGSERLEREHVSWVDVVHMILYYAIQSKEAEHTVEGLKFFHWRNICEEIEVYWPLLWDRDRTGNWQTSVVAALSTFAGVRFQSGKELVGKQLNGFWTLIDNVSPKEIEPPYPRAIDYEILPSGVLRPMERLSRDKHAEAEDSQERESRKLRKQMRKLAATLVFSNLDFDRPNPPGLVSISKLPTHTAPEIKFTEDLMITNDGGYRLARSTHGIDRGGRWYFEVYFHPPTSANQHIRVGWAQILASTQAPVGYDEFSYAIRDADGATIHCGIRRSYASRAIVSDSVIGILLDTPTIDPPALAEEVRGDIEKDYPPLNFNQYHVRQDPLQHGNICFSINGEDCGVAFSHIYHGKYYPAVSMFGGATVTVNLGPNFKYAPPNIQPVSNLTIE